MVAAAMRIPSPVFAAAVCAGLCAAPPAAAAKPTPDLTIARLTTAVDGGTVRVAVDVRHRGSLAPSSPPAREMCTIWEARG
jgi:hypothetical protein